MSNNVFKDNLPSLLSQTKSHALEFLLSLEKESVAATVDAATLRARLGVPLEENGTTAATIIDELVKATEGGQLRSASGRFFGWVIGGALPAALAADWLVSAWDNNATLYACGPAAAICEEVAGDWVKEILCVDRDASFAFTTGCQMAHLTCLASARHALLAERGWHVEHQGLFGAPSIRVLATEHRHDSIDRALSMLGIGTGALVPLTTGSDACLSANVLSAALDESDAPTIVVLNAGDLNVGAFDPFDVLLPLARAAGAWVHIDGAFGLWARASKRHRSKLDGIEHAHSWATDAHKWLNTPKDIGIAIIRDRVAHKNAMSVSAPYLTLGDDTRDAIDWTPDWTRRARGFPVYAAIRSLGRSGVADLIDRCCTHATALANGISALDGAEMVVPPLLNQALVRFLTHGDNVREEDHDQETVAVISAINRTGIAFFSGTTWKGRYTMRISVINWRTTEADVAATIASVDQVLRSRNGDKGRPCAHKDN